MAAKRNAQYWGVLGRPLFRPPALFLPVGGNYMAALRTPGRPPGPPPPGLAAALGLDGPGPGGPPPDLGPGAPPGPPLPPDLMGPGPAGPGPASAPGPGSESDAILALHHMILASSAYMDAEPD